MSPILLLSLVGVAALAVASVKRIPEGTVYTLRRVGGQARLLRSGMHVVIPLLERIVHRISLAGQALPIEVQLPRMDEAPLALRGTVYWQVLDPARADEVIEQAEALIRSRALDGLCANAAPEGEPAEARNLRIKHALNESLRERGVLITRVQLAALV